MAVLRIKSSAILEVIISMVLITLTISLMMVIQLKLIQSNSFKYKIEALSLLNTEINNLKKHTTPLIDSEESRGALLVIRKYTSYNGYSDLVLCCITIYSPEKLKLNEHKLLISLQ
jgi:hypothetical protein